MPDIFRDPTKSLPKSDEQIVRVSMKENQIAGRTDHIPSPSTADKMSISHGPNAGSKH